MSMVIGDNKTVYIAGGAIVKAIVGKNEKYSVEPDGLRNYAPTFILAGHNIRFTGQGIIDASQCPTHARNLLITYRSHHVTIDGIILRNSSGWTVPIVQSDSVTVNNIKILGYRANTDGIDICNSQNVNIENCFVRTNDDLIVIKSFENQGNVQNISVKHCILWNQLASALSIGAELRENVSNVDFSDCDIIHDTGREWSLRIFQCDSSTVSNVDFTNLRIEESHNFMSLWIGKAAPSLNSKLGKIQNITFDNIIVNGLHLGIEMLGGDNKHIIQHINFKNVRLNNLPLLKDHIRTNQYVQDLTIIQ